MEFLFEIELPIEVDKIYKTKYQTGDMFLVKLIEHNIKGKVIGYRGIYQSYQHLGIVPISIDRLIPEKYDGVIDGLNNGVSDGLK